MKTKKRVLENSSIIWWIFGGCAITTLYFTSKIQDPFNSPKMWIIILISAWLTGHIIANNQKSFKNIDIKIFASLLGCFLLFGLIAAITTDISYTAFFGENQRRNGFLTYLALIVFMFNVLGNCLQGKGLTGGACPARALYALPTPNWNCLPKLIKS